MDSGRISWSPYPMIIETERLILRPLTQGDVDAMLEYQSDPDVIRFIPWPVRDRAMVSQSIVDLEKMVETTGADKNFVFGMHSKADGKIIGQVNYMLKGDREFQREIGYVINPKFGGRGYVHEALVAMIGYIFEMPGVERIYATIDPRNVASEKVAIALGMRKEAHHIRDEFFKGEWMDTLIYAILKSEWAKK